jgi:hypothetical protein
MYCSVARRLATSWARRLQSVMRASITRWRLCIQSALSWYKHLQTPVKKLAGALKGP